jgi:hypothetical protein
MERAMKLPLTGGCQCGAVRYEVTAEPLTLIACHCTECQKQSASAFGMTLRVARDALNITGALNRWDRKAESGNTVTCLFCPVCGVRLIHQVGETPPTVNIKAGTLDNTSELAPAGHIWTRSAQPWMRAEMSGLTYDRAPPAMDELIAAWRGGEH